MARNRNREVEEQNYMPEPLRPVFEPNQLEHGVWLELIPHKLRMIITDPGVGPTPKRGEFIRLKQFIYLQDMTVLKQERITYTFNRGRLIEGLQYCLSLCRQGFKARLHIDQALAYGDQMLPGIPPHSNLVIDIEVSSINTEPLNSGKYDDEELLAEIIAKAREGDEYLRKGQYSNAQRTFQWAFARIQSTRCKQIKNYLYSNNKISYLINNEEKTSTQIEKEKAELVQMYKTFDIIKIKTVEVALLNKDYYRVSILTKQCLLESRLEQNSRILAARGRAFIEIGELQQGIKLIKHLSDQFPNEQIYKAELQRAMQKSKLVQRETNELRLISQPILTITSEGKKKKKHKHKNKHKISNLMQEYVDENYEADEEDEQQHESAPFFRNMEIGMVPFGFHDSEAI